jgi:23S rRNA (guanosine2251-2'-O)-methyltransferase
MTSYPPKDHFGKQRGDNKEIIFGLRPVIEAIRAGREIEKILLQKDLISSAAAELINEATIHKIPYIKVPQEKLNSITRKNHQGIICFVSAVSYASLDHVINTVFQSGKIPLILVLDRITDVRNFGAIARTAECCGVHAIVIPSRGAAQINSDAVKTSAGALNYLPVCREENLKQTLSYMQECGLQIVACSEKAEQNLSDFDFTVPVAIVMGSEEDGISAEYLKKANATIKIPLTGKVHSLNVSVAAGMVIYEAIRQRSWK